MPFTGTGVMVPAWEFSRYGRVGERVVSGGNRLHRKSEAYGVAFKSIL